MSDITDAQCNLQVHSLRVSENRMFRKIFGPKRDDVVGTGRNRILGS